MLAVGGLDGGFQLLKVPEDFEPVEQEHVSVGTGARPIAAVAFSPRGKFGLADWLRRRRPRVWNLPQSDGPADAVNQRRHGIARQGLGHRLFS